MTDKQAIRAHLEKQIKIKAAQDAMTALIDATNTMGSEQEVIEGMLLALRGSHRTLQQSFFRAFAKAMNGYSESRYDLRNEASVDFAKKVAGLDHRFPLV